MLQASVTAEKQRASLLPFFDVGRDGFVLDLVGQWAMICVLVCWISCTYGGKLLLEERDEAIGDGFLDIDTGIGHANLAAVPLDAEPRLFGGFVQVRILKDYRWGFPTKFEEHILQIGFCRRDLNLPPRADRARECYDTDIHVGGQDRTREWTVSGDDIQYTWEKSGLFYQSSNFCTLSCDY